MVTFFGHWEHMTRVLIKDVDRLPSTAPPHEGRAASVMVRPKALSRFLQSRQSRSEQIRIHNQPWRTSVTLLISDLIALLTALALANLAQWSIFGEAASPLYLPMSTLVVFLVIYACAGLYPAIPLSPPDELRRLSLITTTVYFSAAAVMRLAIPSTEGYWWAALGLGWLLSLVTVPTARGVARHLCSSRPWWGYPAVILGGDEVSETVVRTLIEHPEIGIKPIAIVVDSHARQPSVAGVPVISGFKHIRTYARKHRIPYAIVPMSVMNDRRTGIIVRRFSRMFRRVMIIPPITHFSSLWVYPVDLGGLLGLETRYRLLDPDRQMFKRVLDLVVIGLTAPLWLPCMAMIAVAIKAESKGPVFFTQSRPGLGGKGFQIFKFRTMTPGAHSELESHLDESPQQRQEWTETGKLRYDPRVTRVGRFLRRTSLDELPQIWNIIRGDMSLVGPRPILHEQRDQYRTGWALYTRVRPGITGVWQVSGRNTLTLAQRIHLDTYYVRNWSIWLDIYLLTRTGWTVLHAQGAY